MAGLIDRLARLRWEDLSKWASPSSVRKGRPYKGRVTGIAQTADGGLLAWVQGSGRYATRVGLDQEGKLVSSCSCPVGHWACKHAVAVVLVGIEQMGTRAGIKTAASDDIRLSMLTSLTSAESEASRPRESSGAGSLQAWSAETGQASGAWRRSRFALGPALSLCSRGLLKEHTLSAGPTRTGVPF
ncbi:MAG: SWIM zinc finger domain-containing protein [Acidobacteriota bacterium]